MKRDALLKEVSKRLSGRRLIWAGLRGDDVEPLADLSQLAGSFTIANTYARSPHIDALSYEDLSGVRVDPEVWDIDEHLGAVETAEFRRSLLRALSVPSALLPYRPSKFLSALWFARRDRCQNLGLFGGHQAAFEHKPWVETAVAELGLPHIPWVYVADEDQLHTHKLLERGPIMLRESRTSGGEGLVRVTDPHELTAQWPHVDEAFVSVSPYLTGGIPVNVGATVWHNGVTVHYPSVQLIGIAGCVTRPFGYCGNDFGLARDLDPKLIDSIERSTITIGAWLRSQGYLGTFGVDFLLHQGKLLFTEINPRFQGSTTASSWLSVENGEGCLLLEHLAALLRKPAPSERPLRDRVKELPDLAHLVVHWTGPHAARLDPQPLISAMSRIRRGNWSDVLTNPKIITSRGASVARITVRDRLTTSGFDLSEPYRSTVDAWNRAALATQPYQPQEVCLEIPHDSRQGR
jgi:hypothetical protein